MNRAVGGPFAARLGGGFGAQGEESQAVSESKHGSVDVICETATAVTATILCAMGNVAASERSRPAIYDPDRAVNEQLQYAEPLTNRCKPFLFANLGLRVSVQAGYGMKSQFLLPDERVLSYPFLHCISPEESSELFDIEKGIEHRVRVEKEMFPLSRATHFEVALLGDSTGSGWFTPDQLKLRVPRKVKECWNPEEQIGSFVPHDGVQIILRRLCDTESYMTRQKDERRAVVSAQKQQLARMSELPKDVKCMIGQYLQSSFDKKETALIECRLDKMSEGAGLSVALGN